MSRSKILQWLKHSGYFLSHLMFFHVITLEPRLKEVLPHWTWGFLSCSGGHSFTANWKMRRAKRSSWESFSGTGCMFWSMPPLLLLHSGNSVPLAHLIEGGWEMFSVSQEGKRFWWVANHFCHTPVTIRFLSHSLGLFLNVTSSVKPSLYSLFLFLVFLFSIGLIVTIHLLLVKNCLSVVSWTVVSISPLPSPHTIPVNVTLFG